MTLTPVFGQAHPPECLTKPPVPPRPTVFSSSESRRLNGEVLRLKEITRDQFHSIEELVAKLNNSRFPEGVTEILTTYVLLPLVSQTNRRYCIRLK